MDSREVIVRLRFLLNRNVRNRRGGLLDLDLVVRDRNGSWNVDLNLEELLDGLERNERLFCLVELLILAD